MKKEIFVLLFFLEVMIVLYLLLFTVRVKAVVSFPQFPQFPALRPIRTPAFDGRRFNILKPTPTPFPTPVPTPAPDKLKEDECQCVNNSDGTVTCYIPIGKWCKLEGF